MLLDNTPVELIREQILFGTYVRTVWDIAKREMVSAPADAFISGWLGSGPDALKCRALAAKIREELKGRSVVAPYESNLIPLPHQILALEKVMNARFIRFLLADEVGMGKTIEAGLVLKELKLRGIVKKTLVIVTTSALVQWQEEMLYRFNERFQIYDTEYLSIMGRSFSSLRTGKGFNIWKEHDQIIVSMDALKPIEFRSGWSAERVEQYNRFRLESVINADFDLIIIDECHKVGGGTEQVARFQMAESLCSAVPNVLLLSATPHRGKSDHFRRILRLLDADAFAGEGVPTIAEINPYVVRTEKRQAIDFSGKHLFTKRHTKMISVCHDTVRHARQKRLLEKMNRYIASEYRYSQEAKDSSYGFLILLFHRLLSSSTEALLSAMEKRYSRISEEVPETLDRVWPNLPRMTASNLTYGGEVVDEVQIELLLAERSNTRQSEGEAIKRMLREIQECISMEADAKLEELISLIDLIKTGEGDPDTEIVIFTEFRATQSMLKRELEQRGGLSCSILHGEMDFTTRVNVLKEFRHEKQVLISTDAGGESLNLQFAHTVVNYDLPWNPMVIEQRIGRVDRIGQKKDVRAYNFMLSDSADQRVYEIIEIKLAQILSDLGIDKTGDVLDSTIEPKDITGLYLTSLLNPDQVNKAGDEWLLGIRGKLENYRSTENILPVTDSSEIDAEKSKDVQHNPLPYWSESLFISYLGLKHFPVERTLQGIITALEGEEEKEYTFNTKIATNNPGIELLTTQHPLFRKILSEIVPVLPDEPVPVLRWDNPSAEEGTWSLWMIRAENRFTSLEKRIPFFVTLQGTIYTALGTKVWDLVTTMEAMEITDYLDPTKGDILAKNICEEFQRQFLFVYRELESEVISNTEIIRKNHKNAVSFYRKQIMRIGLPSVRNFRIKKMEKEETEWDEQFDRSARIVPSLECELLFMVTKG